MPTLVLRCHLGSLLDYFSCTSQHFSEGMKVAAAMLGYFHLGKEVAKISKPKIHGWPLFLMAGPCFSPVSPFRKDGCGLPNSNECIPLFFLFLYSVSYSAFSMFAIGSQGIHSSTTLNCTNPSLARLVPPSQASLDRMKNDRHILIYRIFFQSPSATIP